MNRSGPTEPAATDSGRSIECALERLYRRATFGIRPGIGRVARLLEHLGAAIRHRHDPPLAIAHVTGTNGKGSVCAMIEALARAHGLRTALYTSPHLVRFHERIRVAGRPIADAELAHRLAEVEDLADRLCPHPDDAPTFFELATVVAFRHFDLAAAAFRVIEVGMGGALDATNVVEPTVAVITSVDLDHMQYLGTTRAEVAREKAGIIKPGAPVVIGPLPPDAREIVEQIATERGAPLLVAADLVRVRRLDSGPAGQLLNIVTAEDPHTLDVRLSLLGPHQVDNVTIALVAFQRVLERFAREGGGPPGWPARPDPAAIRRALESVAWPGRMQRLAADPEVWLDGAHNPQAAAVLAATLADLGARPTALVVGMMADKDAAGFFRALAPQITRAWTVPIANARAAAPEALAQQAAAAGIGVATASSVDEAITAAMNWAAARHGRVLIAGSLYLAGEVLARRGRERLFEALDDLA